MNEPELYLQKLGLSESEITVYLRMAAGAMNARDLMKTTKMKRPTIYYALNSLEKRGLVSKSGKEGDATFTLSPFERLMAIAREKEDEAVALTEDIAELIPSLASSPSSKMEKPAVSFFEGVGAVKHVVMDVMYTKNRRVDLVVPEKTFFWGFGEDFLRKYIEERRHRNIKTRNLWEVEIEPKEFKKYYSTFSETRLLPETMRGKFGTTIFLFDDKTLYVSSYENCYAILVTSKEHNDTISALFEGLWGVSQPYPSSAEPTQSKKIPVGIVHGRFQPPHAGHIRYMLAALLRVEHLLIGICTPKVCTEAEAGGPGYPCAPHLNPFTHAERAGMIAAALTEAGIAPERYSFVPFPSDYKHLDTILPKNAVFLMSVTGAGDAEKIAFIERLGYKTETIITIPENADRERSGRVREHAEHGADWKALLSPAVARYIEENGLLEKLAKK